MFNSQWQIVLEDVVIIYSIVKHGSLPQKKGRREEGREEGKEKKVRNSNSKCQVFQYLFNNGETGQDVSEVSVLWGFFNQVWSQSENIAFHKITFSLWRSKEKIQNLVQDEENIMLHDSQVLPRD